MLTVFSLHCIRACTGNIFNIPVKVEVKLNSVVFAAAHGYTIPIILSSKLFRFTEREIRSSSAQDCRCEKT